MKVIGLIILILCGYLVLKDLKGTKMHSYGTKKTFTMKDESNKLIKDDYSPFKNLMQFVAVAIWVLMIILYISNM